MAQMHGVPGEWARVKGMVWGLWPVMAAAALSGFSVATWIFKSANIGIGLSVVSVLFVYFAVWKGLRRIESFYIGARGEERVARILQTLPSAYHVFNDFVAGRKHVDHVVVGPSGVFSIETKNWRGKVTIDDRKLLVDGKEPSRSPVRQAAKEAMLVAKHLGKLGWKDGVSAVLAFASDTFAGRVAEQDGVVVMNACELQKSFAAGRAELLPQEIERLVALMENSL